MCVVVFALALGPFAVLAGERLVCKPTLPMFFATYSIWLALQLECESGFSVRSRRQQNWAESVRGAVGVRCPDLGGKMRPLLGGISSTVVSIRS